MHIQDQLRDECCQLANMIEDIDKICIYDSRVSLWVKRCRLLPNYFDPCYACDAVHAIAKCPSVCLGQVLCQNG